MDVKQRFSKLLNLSLPSDLGDLIVKNHFLFLTVRMNLKTTNKFARITVSFASLH